MTFICNLGSKTCINRKKTVISETCSGYRRHCVILTSSTAECKSKLIRTVEIFSHINYSYLILKKYL